MNTDDFQEALLSRFIEFDRTLATSDGDWVVKGFVACRQFATRKWQYEEYRLC